MTIGFHLNGDAGGAVDGVVGYEFLILVNMESTIF
jgi:hypothetical protein